MKLAKELKNILANSDGIKKAVCNYVSENYKSNKEITCFFNDLANHGCVSGMVGTLIYTSDCEEWYDAHYEDIEELRIEELEASENNWLDYVQTDNLKNKLAWIAFEHVASQVADELGINEI